MVPKKEKMFKYASAALFIFLFSACVSSPSAPAPNKNTPSFNGSFWDASPSGGELIFIGASPRYTYEEDSIQYAVEDAAKKVAVFHSVEGVLTSRTREGSSIWDYEQVTQTSLKSDEDYKKYVEDLTYDKKADVLHIDNAVFVKTRYKGSLTSPAYYNRSLSGKKPGWIEQTPHIPGYIVEVGYASARTWFSDTVNFSIENALFSIIKAVSVTIRGDYENQDGNSLFDFYASSDNTMEARVSLSGFYVLDVWVDALTNEAYALAMAMDVR